jgi:hypothetical protein
MVQLHEELLKAQQYFQINKFLFLKFHFIFHFRNEKKASDNLKFERDRIDELLRRLNEIEVERTTQRLMLRIKLIKFS